MTTKVYVPRETAAVSVGADDVAIAIARCAKENNESIELVRNGSWGATWLEPLVEVLVDDKRIAYGNVVAGDVPALFDAGFLRGGESKNRLGAINEIPLPDQPGSLDFLALWPHRAAQYRRLPGTPGIQGAFRSAVGMGADAVIEAVKTSGLRGRGGAGFPAGIKWQTVADAKGEQKYIACNADEGDSGTFSDRILMEGDPLGLIEGMMIAGFAVGATRGYIYLRSEYPLTHSILSRAIDTSA